MLKNRMIELTNVNQYTNERWPTANNESDLS